MSAAALAILPEVEPLNLTAIARECLDCTANTSEAIDRLVAMALSDPLLLEEIVGRQLRQACNLLINSAVNKDRKALCGEERRAPRTLSAGEFAGVVTITMMDYRVLGRRLGDLTRPDLKTMAAGMEVQAGDLLIKSRWLKLIAEALPGDFKTVNEALTSDKLEELRAKAREQS